jgi:hypothetical protein
VTLVLVKDKTGGGLDAILNHDFFHQEFNFFVIWGLFIFVRYRLFKDLCEVLSFWPIAKLLGSGYEFILVYIIAEAIECKYEAADKLDNVVPPTQMVATEGVHTG